MSETAPEAPVAAAPAAKAPAKKAKKPAGAAKAPRKASGPSVTELLTKAVAASKERNGVSLAALKKALAAAGYDVDKNNSRIKLGLKSLVSKGTLVQTKGTGASGSFKLNKKQLHDTARDKARRRRPRGQEEAGRRAHQEGGAQKPASGSAKKPRSRPPRRAPRRRPRPRSRRRAPRSGGQEPQEGQGRQAQEGGAQEPR
ncbi:histone H1-like [Podarcis lilfordi]|uniref:Histone H1-like n=1 Tax=Podarcis lilfordi TaxID=74358 RepID=A0AA35L7S2_9SAUR|nr:histone H1-like [Podarcis lilfordi]